MRSEVHEVDKVDAWEHFPYPSHHFSSLVLLQAFTYHFSLVYMYVSQQYVASNLVYKFQCILITFCYDLMYFICVQSQQQLKKYS